jgi:hypothetical protein
MYEIIDARKNGSSIETISFLWTAIILYYCCPVKTMKRFKNNISPDIRYVWYNMNHFRGKSGGESLKLVITIIYN